ncbi:cytochrome b [Vibrio paucivorans]|uniref:Cytochrome b/b6 domain-containing protein n=1 Tax=Vibrio paucivorans TaxID=2829489 RepID=A0A9X3CKA2_9VIBR|nr:cytochrome b/b6 domain-containing protein [Vibrio paucivorans]MCW8336380.1 cytochrome b/b6 domain-containing protein [Vibrio paucivorans]
MTFRLLWRLREGWASFAQVEKPYERLLAKITHWALLLVSIAFPLSGIVMSILGGNGLAVFGLELVPMNINPLTQEKVAINGVLAKSANTIHTTLPWIFIGWLGLHIAGAIKHHVNDKTSTLNSMLGRKLSEQRVQE